MKRRTTFLINLIIIYFALEINKTGDLIILGSHVQNIKLGIVGNGEVRSQIHQIVYKLDMAIERSIEQWSEPFLIFLIYPCSNLMFCIFFV